MKAQCRALGIKHTIGPPHTPQLNGVAERYNRTLLDRLKPALKNSPFQNDFWTDAAAHAVWTTNRAPIRTNAGYLTPFELYTGNKPSFRHVQVFGASGHYCLPRADRGKLDDNSRPCFFLGVLPSGDGVLVFDTVNKTTVKTRDAVFNPITPDVVAPHSALSPSHAILPRPVRGPSNYDYAFWLDPESNDHTQPLSLVEVDGTDSPASHTTPDPAPRRSGRSRQAPVRYGDPHAHLATALSPSYKQAIASTEQAEWKAAMRLELDNLIRMKVFELVPRPLKAKIISCRWHLKKKLKNDGTLDKFKARLVARGFTQREGLDFDQTFAPSSRQESLKAFLSFVGYEDWEVTQLDVVAAFLYGFLDEIIYMSQPEGFEDAEHPDYVWKLNKSLYGLKQSARQWHLRFTGHLQRLGFTCSAADPSIYIYRENNIPMASVLIHVDDTLLAAKTPELLTSLNRKLQSEFKMSSPGSVSEFLSFDITRDRASRTFTISQASYVAALIKDFGLTDAHSRNTPCNDHFKRLVKNADPLLKTAKPYLRLLGCLQWLSVSTRPDISFAVNRLSQFNQYPTDDHWKAAIDVLLYLKHFPDLKLVLGGSDITLTGHSDSDWAENLDDRRSTTGFLFRLGQNLVSWQSRRQPTVALSSTEAEYMALSDASRDAIWWRSLLREFGYSPDVTILSYDNKGSGDLARNPCHHKRSKHIDVKHHFVRECVQQSTIHLLQVSTNEMLADLLTKPLKRVKHNQNLQQLGLR